MLTYFDNLKGPVTFYTVPKEMLSKVKEAFFGRLIDVPEEEAFFVHRAKVEKESLSTANYNFFIPSELARGGKEIVMLSLITDEKDPGMFEKTLKTFSLAMKSTKGLYKGFYLGKDQEAKDSSKANDTIRKLSADCYEACRRKPEAQKPGKMLILGLRAVGKSSLLNQVTAQKYNPKIKPTLGTQIIRSAVDNFKFNIYDLGGQEKIREGWYKKNIEPNAIIFVIDVSADKSQHDVAKEEFVRMCENFFGKNAAQKIPEDTPVLILGNKIDLNEKFTEKDIEKLLNPKKHKLNYRIGLTSALNADGIEENFKWLVKAFLFV